MTQMETYEQQMMFPERPPPPQALPNRACAECRRKKSKCDMKRPVCSLCFRIGETCIYPAEEHLGEKGLWHYRESHRPSPPTSNGSSAEVSQEKSSVMNASLENIFNSQTFDTTTLFPDFTSSNDNLASQSGFVDMPGTSSTDFDLSTDTFIELSNNCATDFLSMWSDIEARSSSISTTIDTGELTTLNETSTMLGTAPTSVNENVTKHQSPSRDPTYAIDIALPIAISLIDELFNHVHCCLPLLNSVKFKKKYGYLHMADNDKLDGLSLESALLLNGMFALSARFSKAGMFKSKLPLHRGQQFFLEATRLFEISCKLLDKTCNSLEYTQGVILLTFNALQSGPTRQAWFLCGTCARLACELGLHNTDADLIAAGIDHTQLAESSWKDREERRRAWWVVWDMDTFANAVAFTLFVLNMQQAKNVVTAHLDANGPIPWTNLSDSSCQSAWAWFLAGTTLLRQAVDMVVSQKLGARDMDSLKTRADCFTMAMPEHFHISSDASYFDEENFEEVNWIVSTLLMLQCTLSLARLREKTSDTVLESRIRVFGKEQSPQLQSTPEQSTREYYRFQKEVTRIVRAWSPRHIIYSSPLVTYSLVGPAFVNLLTMDYQCLDTEITKLALKRLARYWMIAEIVSENLRHLESEKASQSSSTSQVQKLWPPILFMSL